MYRSAAYTFLLIMCFINALSNAHDHKDEPTPLNEEMLLEAVFAACEDGDLDALQTMLEEKQLKDTEQLVHMRDEHGATPLFMASLHGQLDIVKFLIDNGADVNQPADDGSTALLVAVFSRQFPLARFLMRSGADVTLCNVDGASPLHGATLAGDVTTVIEMLERGADADLPDKNGVFPIHLAAVNQHLPVLGVLLERGADVNALDNEGRCALHYVCTQETREDESEDEHLFHMAGHQTDLALTARFLLENDALVDLEDSIGRTPLSWCASRGHNFTVEALVEAGANVDLVDKDGATPLLLAFVGQHGYTVTVLLDAGANVTLANKDGESALHYAASYDFPLMLRRLLAEGGDVHQRTNVGWTPLHFAANKANLDCMNILLSVDAIEVDAADQYARTPLLLAATTGTQAGAVAMQELEKRGARIGVTVRGEPPEGDESHVRAIDGWRVAHAAASSGDEHTLAHVLAVDAAQLNAVSACGDTPLHVALHYENTPGVALLLDSGALTNVPNDDGDTPHSLVHRWRNEEQYGIPDSLVTDDIVDADERRQLLAELALIRRRRQETVDAFAISAPQHDEL